MVHTKSTKWTSLLNQLNQNVLNQLNELAYYYQNYHTTVRTPILSHIDLACNTSYRFAASRTVFPRVPPYLAGTVCAFWLTYMIVSLAPIWQRTRADMTSREPKVALTYRDRHTWPNNERVGHQRVNSGCSNWASRTPVNRAVAG